MLQNTSFTLTDVVFLCSLVTNLAAVIGLASSAKAKARKPNEVQDKRISDLEKEVSELKVAVTKDKGSIERLSHEVHLMLEADRALLEHGINGNNIEPMIKSQQKIDDYLIHK